MLARFLRIQVELADWRSALRKRGRSPRVLDSYPDNANVVIENFSLGKTVDVIEDTRKVGQTFAEESRLGKDFGTPVAVQICLLQKFER